MASLLVLCPPRAAAIIPSPPQSSLKASPPAAVRLRVPRTRCRAESSGGSDGGGGAGSFSGGAVPRQALQASLWGAEAAYVLWLFLLPYAPGDPVWAISPSTVKDLLGLSLNFFFILPFLNSVGIHFMEAPVLHPMAEGLFNFVIGWTLLFAPVLYTDCRRGGYKGSLDLLWGFQMFLTNTFLIPYMVLRLDEADPEQPVLRTSKLGSFMVQYASTVALVGGSICFISILWSLFGRPGEDFGGIADRWKYLQSYLVSERLAYAFIWDIVLYSIFQPWLIGDNLENAKREYADIVKATRFFPVVGMVVYLISLSSDANTSDQ